VVCARLLKEFVDLNAATGRDGGIVSVKAEVSDGQRGGKQTLFYELDAVGQVLAASYRFLQRAKLALSGGHRPCGFHRLTSFHGRSIILLSMTRHPVTALRLSCPTS
jgi:hypothetical protein